METVVSPGGDSKFVSTVGAGYIEINPMFHQDRFGHLRFVDGDGVTGAAGQPAQEQEDTPSGDTPAEDKTAPVEAPKDPAPSSETKSPGGEGAEEGKDKEDDTEDSDDVKDFLKQIEELQAQVKAGREAGRKKNLESTKAKGALEEANKRIAELEGKVTSYERQAIVSKVASEINLPANLHQYVTGSNEEEVRASAAKVKQDFGGGSVGGFFSGNGSKSSSQYMTSTGFDVEAYINDQNK